MMDDLIARLARATGPDQELDEAIWRKFGGSVILVKEAGGYEHRRWMDSENVRWAEKLTDFTGSMDCAMQLMPGSIDWELKTARHRAGYIATLFDRQTTFMADAKTPAIALCIAALRARNAHDDH
jgi:hypothetical protein